MNDFFHLILMIWIAVISAMSPNLRGGAIANSGNGRLLSGAAKESFLNGNGNASTAGVRNLTRTRHNSSLLFPPQISNESVSLESLVSNYGLNATFGANFSNASTNASALTIQDIPLPTEKEKDKGSHMAVTLVSIFLGMGLLTGCCRKGSEGGCCCCPCAEGPSGGSRSSHRAESPADARAATRLAARRRAREAAEAADAATREHEEASTALARQQGLDKSDASVTRTNNPVSALAVPQEASAEM